MKTIILIVSALLASAFAVSAQDVPQNKDTGKIKELREFLKKYYDGDVDPGELTDRVRRDLMEEFNRFNSDSSLTEHYPGASRYYAKRPVFAPYGKFIVEPDTASKYYLIIADPLRHTVKK